MEVENIVGKVKNLFAKVKNIFAEVSNILAEVKNILAEVKNIAAKEWEFINLYCSGFALTQRFNSVGYLIYAHSYGAILQKRLLE